MLSLRYFIRLIQAFFAKFNILIVVGIFLGFLLYLATSALLPILISPVERIGIVGRYTPENLPTKISGLISSGLTKLDDDGTVLPNIAKSWETSDGGKTWIFELNDNLVWHDKKTLTATDINYEFSDAKFEVIDNYTVKFTLDSNFSAFPMIVSKPIFKKGLLGIGEWKVSKVRLQGGNLQSLTLQNNNKEKLNFKFYPSEDRLKTAFKLGEVDYIDSISDPEPFINWKKIENLKIINYNSFVGLFINIENQKFSDKTVRQAINYAIDKTGFDGERAISPISPLSWAFNPQVKPYDKDDTKIKEIEGLEIKIHTLPNLRKTAEKIEKDLENSKAIVEIEVVNTVPQEYEIFLATVDIPKDPDQYSLWHSTQMGTNISKLKNPRIDKLLEDGRTNLDTETRKKIYLDFQRFITEEVPAVFLYHPTSYSISRK